MRPFSKSTPKHRAPPPTTAESATKTTGVRFAAMAKERKISPSGAITDSPKVSKAYETVARQVPQPLPEPPHRRQPVAAQHPAQVGHSEVPLQHQDAAPVRAPADDWLDQVINAQSRDDILRALDEPADDWLDQVINAQSRDDILRALGEPAAPAVRQAAPDERPFEGLARVRLPANRAPK
jgi:hypothetical protein